MDQARARALLAGERARLQRLLQAETSRPQAAELGLPPAATAVRSAAARRSPTSGWRPTRWPS